MRSGAGEIRARFPGILSPARLPVPPLRHPAEPHHYTDFSAAAQAAAALSGWLADRYKEMTERPYPDDPCAETNNRERSGMRATLSKLRLELAFKLHI
jgi:hypothetical protein